MLFEETCSNDLLKLVKSLQGDDFFINYFLVGGTSLSLQIGHRQSEDIDLFTLNTQDNKKILEYMEQNYKNINIENDNKNILQLHVNGIKVDFVKAQGKLVAEPIMENGLRLCNIKDIAGIKLNTISGETGRKKAKDYIDIAYLINELSLPVMFDIYKYKYDRDNIFNVKKDLLDVNVINPYTWQNVKMIRKDILVSDVPRIIKDAVEQYNKDYDTAKKSFFDIFKLKPMQCIKYNQIENKDISVLMDEKSKLILLEDYSNPSLNGINGSIRKFTVENSENKKQYVLQRITRDTLSDYICDIWQFNDDFNKRSALNFIKQYDNEGT